MTESANLCPACRQSFLSDGICPECGYSDPNAKPRSSSNRAALWVIFWALFLGTPVLALVSGAQGFVPLLGAGTIGAGFMLSRLFVKNEALFVVMGFMFAAGIFAIYLGIAFVGCLVMMKGASF